MSPSAATGPRSSSGSSARWWGRGSGRAVPQQPLRILAADEDRAALEATAEVLRELGHEVTGYAIGVGEAAERGIDAYAWPVTPENVQGAIDVAVRRHAERRRLVAEVAQLQ